MLIPVPLSVIKFDITRLGTDDHGNNIVRMNLTFVRHKGSMNEFFRIIFVKGDNRNIRLSFAFNDIKADELLVYAGESKFYNLSTLYS